MKLIGAGLPRTGTLSAQAALNRLGFRCYHMQEVPREPGHLAAWSDLVHERATMDWNALFRDYDATVDAPACFYYRELIEAFPDAKVLLTVRDADRWYESVSALQDAVRPLRPFARLIPRLHRFLDLADSLIERRVSASRDRAAAIAAFHRHNKEVQRTVPFERLLVFEVGQGWQPLCDFLGCDVPDTPFPHLNEPASVGARLRTMFLRGPSRLALACVALAAIALLVWLLA